MSGSASFTSGAIDGNATSEALTTGYSYSIDFNTGFTGDDNLYVRIKTGNANDWFKSKRRTNT
jgi:hypothetical protein